MTLSPEELREKYKILAGSNKANSPATQETASILANIVENGGGGGGSNVPDAPTTDGDYDLNVNGSTVSWKPLNPTGTGTVVATDQGVMMSASNAQDPTIWRNSNLSANYDTITVPSIISPENGISIETKRTINDQVLTGRIVNTAHAISLSTRNDNDQYIDAEISVDGKHVDISGETIVLTPANENTSTLVFEVPTITPVNGNYLLQVSTGTAKLVPYSPLAIGRELTVLALNSNSYGYDTTITVTGVPGEHITITANGGVGDMGIETSSLPESGVFTYTMASAGNPHTLDIAVEFNDLVGANTIHVTVDDFQKILSSTTLS